MKYHSEVKCFFRNVYCCWYNYWFSSWKRQELLARCKRLCDGFVRHLSATSSSNATKWVKVRLLLSKPCFFSSSVSFNSWWIKLYQLQTVLTGRISRAKVLKMINLTEVFNISCRGAIDNALSQRSGVRLSPLEFFFPFFQGPTKNFQPIGERSFNKELGVRTSLKTVLLFDWLVSILNFSLFRMAYLYCELIRHQRILFSLFSWSN